MSVIIYDNYFKNAKVTPPPGYQESPEYPIQRAVDGNIDSLIYGEIRANSPVYILIELESEVNLSSITVRHYYKDQRTYFGTKTEVSRDGVSWFTIFDSSVSGTYKESENGKTHNFSERPVRFIRDWLNGNEFNSNSHWVEISSANLYAREVNCSSIKQYPTWSNRETREQANPYPPQLQTLKNNDKPTLSAKTGNYLSLFDQHGKQRPMGYYQSTVLINKVPTANKRVLCFTNHGQLRDETRSDVNGIYRFDHLDLNEKYMFVAQHDDGDPNTAPEYSAVAADWQSPKPYQ